jgi:thiol-disulfide isomerase/thioredoxin
VSAGDRHPAGVPARRRRAFRAAALSTGILAILVACSPGGDQDGTDDTARPAPGFTLSRLDGEGSVSLASLRGRTVVLDFWATWCPPCEFQVPELNRFYDAHRGDSDVAVFGISVDTEGADVVRAWATEKDVRYPILLGGEDLARRYGAVGFPTLYVVGPDGRIVEQHVGLIETATLEATLAAQRATDAS